MLEISVGLEGLSAIRATLGDLKAAAALPDLIGRAVVAGVRRSFTTGTDPNTGQKWAPLKSRHGTPLVNTGRFRRSIRYVSYKNYVSVGTDFPFAAVHQYGATIRPKRAARLSFEVFGMRVFAKKVTVPARRFLPETDEGLRKVTGDALVKTVGRYLLGLAKRAG